MHTELRYIETDEEFIEIIEKANISLQEKVELVEKEYYGWHRRYRLYHNWSGVDIILCLAFCDLSLLLVSMPNISLFHIIIPLAIFVILAIPLYIEILKLCKMLLYDVSVREVPVLGLKG